MAGAGFAVVTIVDRDKANTQERENLLQVFSNEDIIAGKAGEVLDDNTLDFPPFGSFQHFLKFWAITICAGITIIYKFLYIPVVKFFMCLDIVLYQAR